MQCRRPYATASFDGKLQRTQSGTYTFDNDGQGVDTLKLTVNKSGTNTMVTTPYATNKRPLARQSGYTFDTW